VRGPLLNQNTVIEHVIPRLVSNEESVELASDITREELLKVVRNIPTDKSPEPNVFYGLFFKKFWHIIEFDLLKAVQCFFQDAVMTKQWNSAFLVLIPKQDNLTKPKHFRPISLCNVIYKIVTKILANRLKEVLPKLILPAQAAFVRRRSITDSCMIAQETLHSSMEKSRLNKNLMVIKLDMQRAYDRMRWLYLLKVLCQFGFSQRWIACIEACIVKPSFAVLINGLSTS